MKWCFDLLPDILLNWLLDWLAGWLAAWLASWLAGWLADWLTDRFSYLELSLTAFLNKLFFDWLVDWFLFRLTSISLGCILAQWLENSACTMPSALSMPYARLELTTTSRSPSPSSAAVIILYLSTSSTSLSANFSCHQDLLYITIILTSLSTSLTSLLPLVIECIPQLLSVYKQMCLRPIRTADAKQWQLLYLCSDPAAVWYDVISHGYSSIPS